MNKFYLACCSLSLLVGAGLGHINGHYSAADKFAKDCSSRSIVAFHHSQDQEPRHFHCFELDLANPERSGEDQESPKKHRSMRPSLQASTHSAIRYDFHELGSDPAGA